MLPALPPAFEAPLPMTLIWLTFIASAMALLALAFLAVKAAQQSAAARRAIAADPPEPHWALRRTLHPPGQILSLDAARKRGMVREEGDR